MEQTNRAGGIAQTPKIETSTNSSVDHDNAHVSFLVLDDSDNKPVGTVRFVPKKGKLTRLAVLKDYRKYGLGKELVRALEEHVAAGEEDVKHLIHEKDGKKVATVKIHSQVSFPPPFPFFGIGNPPMG